MRQLNISTVTWPARGVFRISRSALSEFYVVQVTITDGHHSGRGECRPYARYNETPESVTAQIEEVRRHLETGISVQDLQGIMPPGAARNAVDCALWDLDAKQSGTPIWQLMNISEPKPRITAFTLSVDTPEKMALAAKDAAAYPVLKMKIGGEDGLGCILAVLSARPDAQLIVDANEALNPGALEAMQKQLSGKAVVMIEQPLPASDSHIYNPALLPPICADEALHTVADLDRLWEMGYRAVNVKLDKCGGLTAGLKLMRAAKDKGFTIMAGCMVSSSLAMAPTMMLESFADVIDLDGPLLLARDIENGLRYDGAKIYPPTRDLWG